MKTIKRHTYCISRVVTDLQRVLHFVSRNRSRVEFNSLIPISSDPNNLPALTPSQFLTGNSQVEPVKKNYLNVPDNCLPAVLAAFSKANISGDVGAENICKLYRSAANDFLGKRT